MIYAHILCQTTVLNDIHLMIVAACTAPIRTHAIALREGAQSVTAPGVGRSQGKYPGPGVLVY